MSLFYFHNNGHSFFVKEADLFAQQGGLTEPWGEHWRPIEAHDIEDARGLAKLRDLTTQELRLRSHSAIKLNDRVLINQLTRELSRRIREGGGNVPSTRDMTPERREQLLKQVRSIRENKA